MEIPLEAYRGDKPYVFICYSHGDQAVVYPEITWLHDQGIRIWYDEGISPGEEWSEELGQAIDRAERVLYFVSPRSVASRHCRNELNFAQNHDKSILSVYLEKTELPSGVELVIGASQAIMKPDLSEAGYRMRLLRALGRPANRKGVASPPRTRMRLRRNAWVLVLACLGVLAGLGYWLVAEGPATHVEFDRSIAVLPLTSVGAAAPSDTYARALTEELRARISRYQELRTVSPSDANAPHDAVGASYALAGNLQRLGELGDRLRLRVNLTRASNGETFWSETFENPVAAVGDDPTALAFTVARFVRLRLIVDYQCETVRRTTQSEEAAAAYCAAIEELYWFSQIGTSDLSLVMRNAQRALALDPGIADAYGVFARVLGGLTFAGAMDWRQAAREAHAAFSKGLRLAPDDPRLLYSRGYSLFFFLELDYAAAEASLLASLASDPLHADAYSTHHVLGLMALAMGDGAAALEHAGRALHLNDSDADVYVVNVSALALAGYHREAIEAANAGLDLVQTGPQRTYLVITKAAAQAALGESQAASATLDDGLATVGRNWRAHLAGSLARLGRTEEARQLIAGIEALEEPPMLALWALVTAYAALDHDRAFELIHTVLDRHSIPLIITLRWDPGYAEMRKDPRWPEVIRHLEAEEERARANGDQNRQS